MTSQTSLTALLSLRALGTGASSHAIEVSMTPIDMPPDFTYRIRSRAAMRQKRRSRCASEFRIGFYKIAKRGRLWELRDAAGDLVCLTAYKKGAAEVARRLSTLSSFDAAL